jgi:DNA-binding beta-propeller fold protein YncE
LPFHANVLKSSPSAAKVYVTDGSQPQVVLVDAAGDSILRIIVTPARVRELGYSPAQKRWYLLSGADSLFVLDADSDTLIAAVPAPRGGGPEPVWFGRTDRLYYHATGTGSRFVVAFDCRANLVIDTLDANFVRGCDTTRNRVYCTDDSTLLVYDGTTDSLIARVPVPSPGYVAVNPADGRVYVGSSYSDVYVIRDPSGVAEARAIGEEGWKPPTIIRGVLSLPPSAHPGSPPPLLDICGRKVLDLLPGPNDVRGLAPGVYFVRGPSAVSGEPSAVRKVVIAQ